MKLTFLKDKSEILCLIACILFYCILCYYISPFVPDDAYISFRYAENLAEGNGLTFNPGEKPVESYSNFLWILITAAAFYLQLDISLFIIYFGMFLGIISILVFYHILKNLGMDPAKRIILLILFSFSGPFILYSVSGMETSLYCLVMLLIIACLERIIRKGGLIWHILLAVFCVILNMTRPEGIVMYFIILGLLIVSGFIPERFLDRKVSINISKRYIITGIIIFLCLLTIYQAWRISYFGEVFSTPFLTKKGGGRSLLFSYYINFRWFFLTHNIHFAPLGYYYLPLYILGLYSVIASFISKGRKIPVFEAAVLLIVIAYSLFYVNFVDWMPAMRYFVPFIPLLLIVSGAGLKLLFDWERPLSRILNYSVIILIIFILNFSFITALKRDAVNLQESTQKSLRAIGEWLNENLPEDTLFAISDAGAAPFYSKLPVFDINPFSLIDINIAKNGWSDDYFFEKSPDVVAFVSFSITSPNFYEMHYRLYSNPRFRENYRLIGISRYDWFRDRSYWVFVHNDISLDEDAAKAFPKGLTFSPKYQQ